MVSQLPQGTSLLPWCPCGWRWDSLRPPRAGTS